MVCATAPTARNGREHDRLLPAGPLQSVPKGLGTLRTLAKVTLVCACPNVAMRQAVVYILRVGLTSPREGMHRPNWEPRSCAPDFKHATGKSDLENRLQSRIWLRGGCGFFRNLPRSSGLSPVFSLESTPVERLIPVGRWFDATLRHQINLTRCAGISTQKCARRSSQ
jgi:hypothetical protein